MMKIEIISMDYLRTAAVREDKEVKVLGMKDLLKVQMFQWREALGEEVNGQ